MAYQLVGAGLVLVVLAVWVALPIWVVIDARHRPEWAFKAAGASKRFWTVAPIVLIFVPIVFKTVIDLAYVFSVRGRVRRQQDAYAAMVAAWPAPVT